MRRLLLLCISGILLLAPLAPSAAQKNTPSTKETQPSTKTVPAKEEAKKPEPPPLNILSIIPSQGEPGRNVTLVGTGFDETTIAFLGNQGSSTTLTSAQQVSFDIPNLAPGLYALFLRRADGTISKTYNFTIVPPKPVADALLPDRIYACAAKDEREVVVAGANFTRSSRVLFDGAVIRSTYQSPETITFFVPEVIGGLHQVQIKNPDETASFVLGLFIDGKPEINNVSIGDQYVNYYELVIEGINFRQGSSLIIDGRPLNVMNTNQLEREQVRYVDCTKLIYERHPYDTSTKSFQLQVINPNRDESALVHVSAP